MKKIAQRFFSKMNDDYFIPMEGTEVKILFSSENPSLLGYFMEMRTPLCQKSIRLEVEHPIEIDSVLDISVKLDNNPRVYNLTGNVRWRLPAVGTGYQIVLVLRERMDIRSDYKAWKANFVKNFEYSKAG